MMCHAVNYGLLFNPMYEFLTLFFFVVLLPCPDFNQISCPSENVCFAVAENMQTGFILRTQDAGNTWDTLMTVESEQKEHKQKCQLTLQSSLSSCIHLTLLAPFSSLSLSP